MLCWSMLGGVVFVMGRGLKGSGFGVQGSGNDRLRFPGFLGLGFAGFWWRGWA